MWPRAGKQRGAATAVRRAQLLLSRRRMVRATRVADASQATSPGGDQVHLQFPDGGGCVQADHVRVRRRQLRQNLDDGNSPVPPCAAAPIAAAAVTDNKSIDN
jgi:hypothetical protein